jgi:Rhodopirellula transposase DDE domain
VQTQRLQLKVDNGPESSGVRTQFLKRMVQFCDQIGKPIQLLYYPPYHSKYNPIVGFALPKGTLLGNSRTTLERYAAEGYWHHLGMGKQHGVEGNSPDC